MGIDRHPTSERIAEELHGLRSQVHKGTPRFFTHTQSLNCLLQKDHESTQAAVSGLDGVLGVAMVCGIAGALLVLFRLMRRR